MLINGMKSVYIYTQFAPEQQEIILRKHEYLPQHKMLLPIHSKQRAISLDKMVPAFNS